MMVKIKKAGVAVRLHLIEVCAYLGTAQRQTVQRTDERAEPGRGCISERIRFGSLTPLFVYLG